MFREQQTSWSERSSFRPYLGPITHIPEEWRSLDFLGYPDYDVSDLGRVRSLKHGKVRVLRQSRRSALHPYVCVALRAEGRTRSFNVHNLVALAFLSPVEGATQVAHNDGDGTNNRAANLRWETGRGNQLDRRVHGTVGRGPTTTDDEVRAMRKLFGSLSDRRVARMFGISTQAARDIRIGRRRAGVK